MTRQTWKQFIDAGLMWWINRILHTFGWSVVFVEEKDGRISEVYPARTNWLGFDSETNVRCLGNFQQHLKGRPVDQQALAAAVLKMRQLEKDIGFVEDPRVRSGLLHSVFKLGQELESTFPAGTWTKAWEAAGE